VTGPERGHRAVKAVGRWEKGEERLVQLTGHSSSKSQCEKVIVNITSQSMCNIVIGVHILSKWI